MKRKIFTEEHEMFRETIRDYIKSELVPRYDEWEKAGQVPREVWKRAGELGWLCPTAEERYGGMGADFLYNVVLTEELYYHGVSGVFFPLHNDIVFPYLEKLANEEQKERWIPGCVNGDSILALCMTEPDVGSDIKNLKTRAEPTGTHYRVNGSKTFISNGQLANLMITAVRTDPRAEPAHRGISLIMVEDTHKGFARGRNLEKIGFHAQDTSELFFEDCEVPAENLLGEEGKGFAYMMSSLQQERLALAVGALAAAAGTLDITLKYVKEREAFGQNLGKFQNVRFELADIATKIQLGQSFIDDLVPRHMAGESLVREVSMAKYWLTDLQFEAADRCLQLFGGYGYMKEYPVSRYFVDARVQRIYGGANEIMKELVARELGL